jgi:hypothetical protein
MLDGEDPPLDSSRVDEEEERASGNVIGKASVAI